jgi:hypothetical protein
MHECLRYLTLFVSLCLVCGIAQNLTDDLKPDLISPATARFNYYWQRTYSANVLGEIAFNTGIDHLTSKPEFGRGLSDYASRFASGFGHKLITTTTEFGVSSLLHEDTQYHPSGLKGFLPRAKYALTHAYLAYGSSGKLEPSYGKFAGIMVSSAIEPNWRGRGNGLSGSMVGRSIGFRLLNIGPDRLLTEFEPDLTRLRKRYLRRLLR